MKPSIQPFAIALTFAVIVGIIGGEIYFWLDMRTRYAPVPAPPPAQISPAPTPCPVINGCKG